MKKIFKVEIGMNTRGEMLIVVKYLVNSKIVTEIEPFSEEALLKYKIKYEKQRAKNAKIINKIRLKTETENIEINEERFTKNTLAHVGFIVEMATIATIAFFAVKGVSNLIDDFKNMESPIIPEDEIEYQDPNYNPGAIDIENRHK